MCDVCESELCDEEPAKLCAVCLQIFVLEQIRDATGLAIATLKEYQRKKRKHD